MAGQVFRCPDGHLFTASWLKINVLSAHFGFGTYWTRCPVDRKWRTVSRVNANSLSDTELDEAGQNRF